MIKAAIFDLDGTLLDSNGMWRTLGERYILSLGKTPANDLYERLRELSLESSARLVKSEYCLSFSENEIIEQVMEICAEFYRSEVMPKNGARELLEQLSERNIEMKILTSSYAELAEAALKRLGLIDFFDEICGGADKSTPNVFLSVSEAPHETLVFEDALYAVKTAKAAGFVTCAVYDAFEKKQEELQKNADFYRMNVGEYVGDIDEILGFAEKK
ncbi:MAG: HAD hydrolase-like protein [Oscillospiraceae bacterium]|nr:HAD hydrolase-like protein [Oscillospiraceae bacterium]